MSRVNRRVWVCWAGMSIGHSSKLCSAAELARGAKWGPQAHRDCGWHRIVDPKTGRSLADAADQA